MSAITIGGDLIHYEKLGRGRPVILVHGWIGSWRYWIPLMQRLHTSFSVYTLDLIGFGDSSKNADHYSIEKQVAMLETFLEQLGIPKAAIIGHGLGSMVVLQFALNNPDKVARMMLNSLPLFDPGGLQTRVGPDTRRKLTSNSGGDRYSLAPSIEDVMGSDQTIPSSGTGADKTIVSGSSGIYTPFHELPTVGRPDTENIDRDALKRAAEERRRKQNAGNPLSDLFKGQKPINLLGKCFDTREPEFDKLKVDVEKSDSRTLNLSVQDYEAGEILDDLHRADAPILLVHGANDPVLPLPQPSNDVLDYLTGKNKSEYPLVPVILDDTRHFPMLEHDLYSRLTNDFLTKPDISKIELRGVWKRRSY